MKQLTGLAALSFLLLTTSAFAQEKRAMTFEDVLAVKSVSDVQVSPDWLLTTTGPILHPDGPLMESRSLI